MKIDRHLKRELEKDAHSSLLYFLRPRYSCRFRFVDPFSQFIEIVLSVNQMADFKHDTNQYHMCFAAKITTFLFNSNRYVQDNIQLVES